MSRPLASIAVGSLLLALGTFASACPTCDLPPASAPIQDPPPHAIFEAGAPGALLPAERGWILGLEGGRYEPINGRLADREAAVAAQHLLTNSSAWTLLGRRASERAARLRALAQKGPLSEGARGEAVALFWVRGTLLSDKDQAFLREAIRPRPQPEPGVGRFEDGAQNAGDPPLAPGGPADAGGRLAPADPAAQTAHLLRTLRASLEIAPDADPRAAAAMNEALASLVNTPTGRELAMEFTASGARGRIEFGDVPNSTTVVMNGRRVLTASGGHTVTTDNPPRVVLNRHFLDTDADFRRVKMASILGHELFGHGFEEQRSRKEGVSHQVVYYYRGDEAGSGLIEWLVQAELGGRLDNGHMWNYLSDPEKYHTELKTNLSYYTTTLSTAEMRVPVATLEGRFAAIETARNKAREHAVSMVAWRPIIDHFVNDHAMTRELFSSLAEDIDAGVVWSAARQKSLDAIHENLTTTITKWKSSDAESLKADLASAAGSDYLRRCEERLSARAARLGRLTAGRAAEPATPPVPGKLTWADLQRLLAKDRAENPDPRHWEAKK